MENIAPIHGFLFAVIIAVKGGQSLHECLPPLMQRGRDDFHRELRIWWLLYCHQNETYRGWTTHHRKLLAEVLGHGLQGLGVLASLEELYAEVSDEIENRQQLHLERLPFRLLLPLLLCFFPAFLILLFGPLILHIQSEVFGS